MPEGQSKEQAEESTKKYIERRAVLEKLWEECSVEEKLEKIKAELSDRRYISNHIHNLQIEVNKLKEHSHQDGKIVIPLNANSMNGIPGAGQASRHDYLR